MQQTHTNLRTTCLLCASLAGLLLLGIFIGGLVVWKQRGNLKRILSGTESKFSLHHKKE